MFYIKIMFWVSVVGFWIVAFISGVKDAMPFLVTSSVFMAAIAIIEEIQKVVDGRNLFLMLGNDKKENG